jgi:hypothetical protein
VTTAQLLRAAADALDDGTDPFSLSFLSEHDVTSDQCLTLAEQLAIGSRIVADAITSPRSPAGVAYALTLAARS